MFEEFIDAAVDDDDVVCPDRFTEGDRGYCQFALGQPRSGDEIDIGCPVSIQINMDHIVAQIYFVILNFRPLTLESGRVLN